MPNIVTNIQAISLLGTIKIQRTETTAYTQKAEAPLYFKRQIPITIDVATRKTSLAGMYDDAKSKTRQRAAHIPPPESLCVFMISTPFH